MKRNIKIVVASTNENKIEGIKKAFNYYFNNISVLGYKIESNVSNQPFDDQIKLGAINRIKNLKNYCKTNKIKANYFVSVESGIINLFEDFYNISFCVIDDGKKQNFGISSAFLIPKKFIKNIEKIGLGNFTKEKFRNKNYINGTIGILTKNIITRAELTNQSTIMALNKFLNKE